MPNARHPTMAAVPTTEHPIRVFVPNPDRPLRSGPNGQVKTPLGAQFPHAWQCQAGQQTKAFLVRRTCRPFGGSFSGHNRKLRCGFELF